MSHRTGGYRLSLINSTSCLKVNHEHILPHRPQNCNLSVPAPQAAARHGRCTSTTASRATSSDSVDTIPLTCRSKTVGTNGNSTTTTMSFNNYNGWIRQSVNLEIVAEWPLDRHHHLNHVHCRLDTFRNCWTSRNFRNTDVSSL